MSLVKAFSDVVGVVIAKNENISYGYFANKPFMDLLRRTSKVIVESRDLAVYEKYALADAVATLAIFEGQLISNGSNTSPENGFHFGGKPFP